MSKRKGVSADEKRTRLLEIFYEKKEFFQLKELEKIAPKEKGIVAQSVKDVLQSLVDDGMVDSEKIGTSIYFWAFPSKAKTEKKCKIEDTLNNIEEYKKKLEFVNNELIAKREENTDVKEKEKALQMLAALQKSRDEIIKEISRYSHCDPEYISKLENNNEDIKAAANRWTENIFSTISWCSTKFSIESDTLKKQFGIPENIDYIE